MLYGILPVNYIAFFQILCRKNSICQHWINKLHLSLNITLKIMQSIVKKTPAKSILFKNTDFKNEKNIFNKNQNRRFLNFYVVQPN